MSCQASWWFEMKQDWNIYDDVPYERLLSRDQKDMKVWNDNQTLLNHTSWLSEAFC